MGCGSSKSDAGKYKAGKDSNTYSAENPERPVGSRTTTSVIFEEQTAPTEEEKAAEDAKMKAQQGRSRRPGVAAPSLDQNQVKDYKKPVHEKGAEANETIKRVLKENQKMQVLCGHLDEGRLVDVVNAFYPKEFEEGAQIIRQSDEGDCLYILDKGSVEIFVKRPDANGQSPDECGSKVATWNDGALFGELALMYNAPRAATVVALAPKVTAWALDALDFKMLLAQHGQAQCEKYEGWLSNVEILKTLNYSELSRIADSLQREKFAPGADIIKQGDKGDKFYILEEGKAAAYISGADGKKQVHTYSTVGDYFGELALLTSQPRKATVTALEGGCTAVSLSAEQFTNMLGPCSEILKKNSDKYPQYADLLQ
mmetsp:Transcript_47737/g.134796  ORF Transcript_47737/g.134796 Transcript_47737/m.134796 type:complete len:370 (+) Transcript_47737:65-1174(+)|eukprot:CAMPEP_0179274916 /NCGR_PEP_ID=MMETSP0797-20121207/33788_1 /TAXON_ID=47934 /ORGANISM="Dinophysis acuminata, Strain DAEP01" /LENGTH=369 /DNA_ID=CAMNT_0020983415 /DNA_START=58 /DNA_END=1167 /DNA_ORIENTATION=-